MDGTIAEIRYFAGNYAPIGWALCNGQALSISENETLFVLIGTTYGGDGLTNFQLPDLRGRVVVGTGRGLGLSTVVLGQVSGSEGVSLLTTQMAAHSHGPATVVSSNAAAVLASSAQASLSAPAPLSAIAAPGDASTGNFVSTLGYNTSAPDKSLHASSLNTSNVVPNTDSFGGSLPHNNIQPSVAINYIICTQGIFPSRN